MTEVAPHPALIIASSPAQAGMSGEADEIALFQSDLGKLDFKDSVPSERPVTVGPELLETLASVPAKMAFKIGEVAEMVGVKQYVLRYWESEFESLRPKKSKNNQRVYTRREVETAFLIKKLLYQDRFSIEGARAALKQLKSQVKQERDIRSVLGKQEQARHRLEDLITEIRRIKALFT